MTTDTTKALHEGDRVQVTKGQYKGKKGTIERIGHSTGLLIDVVPLYIVRLDPLVYERDEIERVEPMPAPQIEIERIEESRGVV